MGEAFLLFVFGVIAAFIGVSLPGLLNMTAVKISKNEDSKSAYKYLSGVLAVIFFQTYIAVFFANIIDSNPFISNTIREIGLVIFIILTIYFLIFAPKKEGDKEQFLKTNDAVQGRFFYGVLLAILNFFPIPYYVFLSIAIASYNFPIFDALFTVLFCLGVILGSVLMFCVYMSFFKKYAEDSFVIKNINYLIGGITGIISLVTLWRLLQ